MRVHPTGNDDPSGGVVALLAARGRETGADLDDPPPKDPDVRAPVAGRVHHPTPGDQHGGNLPAMALRAEFTVEPFVSGAPGPHVQAAIAAARDAGLTADIGPFGTRVEGPDDVVAGALSEIVRRSTAAGATRVSIQVTVP